MKVMTGLRALERFECQLADLYQMFADRFASVPGAAAFAQLASASRRHAQAIAYQRRVLRQNGTLLDRLHIDLPALEEASARVRDTAARACTMSCAQAAARALDLERSPVRGQVVQSLRVVDESFAALIAELFRTDQRRGRMLERLDWVARANEAATATAAPIPLPPAPPPRPPASP